MLNMGASNGGTMLQMLIGLCGVQLLPNIFNGTTCGQVYTGTVPRIGLETVRQHCRGHNVQAVSGLNFIFAILFDLMHSFNFPLNPIVFIDQ